MSAVCALPAAALGLITGGVGRCWTAEVRAFRSLLCLFNDLPKAGSHQQALEPRRVLHGRSLPAFPRYWGHSPVQVPANELPLRGARFRPGWAGRGSRGVSRGPDCSACRVRSEGQLGGQRRGQRRDLALGPGTWPLTLPPCAAGQGLLLWGPQLSHLGNWSLDKQRGCCRVTRRGACATADAHAGGAVRKASLTWCRRIGGVRSSGSWVLSFCGEPVDGVTVRTRPGFLENPSGGWECLTSRSALQAAQSSAGPSLGGEGTGSGAGKGVLGGDQGAHEGQEKSRRSPWCPRW